MEPITLLQWNVLYKEKIENIVSLLEKVKPDIISMQELSIDCKYQDKPNTAEYVASEMGYNSYYKESPVSGPGMKFIVNGIFTRFPIAESQFQWVNEPDRSIASGYDNEYRSYIEAKIQTPMGELTAGTTHLSYTHRFINYQGKKAEVDRLLHIIDTKKRSYIFSGDLNSLPNSYAVRSIKRRLRSADPPYDQMTWTTKPFSYRGFEETELKWRLDYVFVSRDIRVLSSDVVRTDFSDHLPILTKFVID